MEGMEERSDVLDSALMVVSFRYGGGWLRDGCDSEKLVGEVLAMGD